MKNQVLKIIRFTSLKKSVTYIALLLSLLLVATSCTDSLYSSSEPVGQESEERALSSSVNVSEETVISKSPSESPVTFPRLVCKEGQWFLETGFREEDLPKPDHWSENWAVIFDSYEDFVRRIKEVDFTEEQLVYMKSLMVYYYSYKENGAMAIPDPALLEGFSFPFLGDSGFEPEMGTVYWGLGGGIRVFPSNRRSQGGPGDDCVLIYEKDDYNQWFKYLEEEWKKGFFETAESEEISGLVMYLCNDNYVYRVETERFTAWINKSEYGRWQLHIKEKNGLCYSYIPDYGTSVQKTFEQIKAVFGKYGYELVE